MAAAMLPPRRHPRPFGTPFILVLCVARMAGIAQAQALPAQDAAVAAVTAPTLRCPEPSRGRSGEPVRVTPMGGVAASGAADAADAPVDISSDSAILGVDGNASLSGKVRITQGNRRIEADDVEYDARKQDFSVRGAVRYQDPTLRAQGSNGSYSPTGGATFEGARFELPERPARGEAGSLSLDTAGVLSLQDVWFSTCPAETPDWRIRARSIELDTRTRNGTGRSASVEFKGVPILYLPYISFPIGDQRKSGFLFPSLGHSNRGGAQFALPYYFDIAPNLDLTIQPTWYSRRGLDGGADLRYLTSRQRGSLRVNHLAGDRITGEDRSWVRFQHRAELPAGWRINLDGQNVSDAEYFEDFAQGREGTSTAFLERIAQVSYRDEHWRLRGEVQQFQTIDRALASADRPYARVPRLLASGQGFGGPGDRLSFGLDAEVVNFERDTGVTGWRLDAAPTVGLDLSGAGYFARPSAGYRYTRYELQDAAPGSSESLQRSLPFAALDAGLMLEREVGTGGRRRVTLEPRLLYLWTPYRDQSALPVFDTAIPDLNFVQLFSTNRYVGADRVSDANQASIGLTTSLFDSRTGARFLSATVGQAFYFTDPRVTLPGEARRTGKESDLVAQLALDAYQNWSMDFGLQWNTQDPGRERSQVRVQYRPGADRAVNFAYRFQRDRLEQGEVSGAWPIGSRWNLFARVVYDLQESDSLERFAGLEYKACCWRLRAVARRFVSSRTGQQDTGVYLQLELNGLSSVGSAADTFLEQAIRGYSEVGVSR
jgi:LPS-assembly protein